jgi:hypothetical protein
MLEAALAANRRSKTPKSVLALKVLSCTLRPLDRLCPFNAAANDRNWSVLGLLRRISAF